MRKYIPLVLFIFSWPVLCADIHGRVVRVLDGDTIEVMDSRKAVRIRLINSKRLVRTVLIFTESSDQLSRATDRVP
ncbi:thermonuclease family protein, partial [Escherichia coli]|uniref:thermonuclease family protein n=2 Tax=Escherichia coli TaxID=562 RepID=UPI00350E35DD